MKRYLCLALALVICMLFLPLLAGTNLFSKSDGQTPPSTAEEDTFLLLDEADGAVLTVNAYDYLCGAVAAEMPPSFHTEALKAQAVAAYTGAYRKREQQKASPDPALQGAHFTVNTAQKLGYLPKELAQAQWGDSFAAAWERIETAVKEVSGKLLVYEGEPILAVYHSISGGATETAGNYWGNDVPYLQSVESPGDTMAPEYQTQVSFQAADLQSALTTAFPELTLPEDTAAWFGAAQLSPAGTVTSIAVGNATLTGRQIRETLGLRSANFQVLAADGVFTFTVKGYGHGVGMSQYGADYMARQGTKWQDILTHYYKGASILSVEDAGTAASSQATA